MSNLELVLQAIRDIDTYRNPDISRAKALLSSITEAMGHGGLAGEYIRDLDIDLKGMVRITTEWSVRGCANTSDYEFPASILEAPDPVRSAKLYGLEQAMTRHRKEMESHQQQAEWYRGRFEEIARQHQELSNNQCT
jgi:hypothetical protein